jgi:DNA-binding NarL/FixJ family response regulator
MSAHKPTVCRVLIADDHAIVRSAVRALLESIEGVEIVGETADGLATIAQSRALRPDLLVLDVSMPKVDGLAVLGEIRRWSPTTRVVVMTGIAAKGTLQQMRAAGAAGLLLKSCTPEELDLGFREVVAGGTFVAYDLRSVLDEPTLGETLTMRERQVLSLITQGRSNADIAALLNVSVKTAETHRMNLMRKLGVHSAAELTALAFREGLVSVPPGS